MNRQTSAGNPGYVEKRRVSGIMSKLMEVSLDGSVKDMVTAMRKQSLLVACEVLLTGKYPDGPVDVNRYSPQKQAFVAREMTKRAVEGGKCFGTPHALLVNAPWFPQYFDTLRAGDKKAEHALAPLDTMREHFVVDSEETYKLRHFQTTKTDGNVAEIVSRVNVRSGSVTAYGGGNLFKEQKVASNSCVTNVEIGDVIAPAQTALAINSLVQDGTVDLDDLHEATGAICTVAVVPTDKKPTNAKRAKRFDSFAKYDDEIRMRKYLEMARDEFAPILCNGENRMFTRFQRANVLLNTAGCATPNMPALREKFRKQHSEGRRIVKKKLDGVRHRLVCQPYGLKYDVDGIATLSPREVNADQESVSAQGSYHFEKPHHIAPPIVADLELVNGKWHCVKVLTYGMVDFNTESAQSCIEFEKKVSLYFNGEKIEFCGQKCACPSDGIVVEDVKGAAVFYKTTIDTDAYVSTTNHVDNFVTTSLHPNGTVTTRERSFAIDSKSKRSATEVTLHPEVIMPYADFLNRKVRYVELELPRPPSLLKAAGISRTGNSCQLCKKIASDFCSHGKFCHGHMCEDCLQGHVCDKCGETGANACTLGGYHCGRMECVCKEVLSAWEFKELN